MRKMALYAALLIVLVTAGCADTGEKLSLAAPERSMLVRLDGVSGPADCWCPNVS